MRKLMLFVIATLLFLTACQESGPTALDQGSTISDGRPLGSGDEESQVASDESQAEVCEEAFLRENKKC